VSEPKQAKGGVFAPTDIPLIKRALHSYLVECIRTEDYSERDPHPDVVNIANLLHRLGRIDA
jgi:hypothetical protein